MYEEIKLDLKGIYFTWDDNKAALNWKKHKVDFKMAAEVFLDDYAIDDWDLEHNIHENRRIIIGATLNIEILFVVYVERIRIGEGNIIRIISARPADREEVKRYERGFSK